MRNDENIMDKSLKGLDRNAIAKKRRPDSPHDGLEMVGSSPECVGSALLFIKGCSPNVSAIVSHQA